MQGWNIFIHSVRMVFGNLGPALRISGLLYLVYMIVNTYYMLNYYDALAELQHGMSQGEMPKALPDGLVSAVTLNIVVSLVSSLWIAVLWHRFVLLGEVPETIIPPFYMNMVLTYLGKTILLGLLLGLVGVAIGVVLGLAIAPLLGAFASVAIPMILLGMLLYFSYRLGLIFPAVALGEKMTFKMSWDKTAVASGAIAQLVVTAIGFVILIQIPSGMNPNPASVINLLYSFLVGWIAMLVGVGVLTTLYGIYVEGRDL